MSKVLYFLIYYFRSVVCNFLNLEDIKSFVKQMRGVRVRQGRSSSSSYLSLSDKTCSFDQT